MSREMECQARLKFWWKTAFCIVIKWIPVTCLIFFVFLLKTGITNDVFRVKLTSTSSGFNCTFMEVHEFNATQCTCAVSVSYNENCDTLLGLYSASGPIGSVIVTVPFRGDIIQYCYVARGTCGGKTAVVEGTLNFVMTSKFLQSMQ